MRSAIRRFLRDERAVFGILLGLLMLPLTMSAFMGIEYFRLVEFRDRLDSIATQVAVASAAGKNRPEAQRLADGRALLARVMEQHKLNANGSGSMTVEVRRDSVTATVKLEGLYKYEFAALLRQSGTRLAVERTISVGKQRSSGSDGSDGGDPDNGGSEEEGVIDPEDAWSY